MGKNHRDDFEAAEALFSPPAASRGCAQAPRAGAVSHLPGCGWLWVPPPLNSFQSWSRLGVVVAGAWAVAASAAPSASGSQPTTPSTLSLAPCQIEDASHF